MVEFERQFFYQLPEESEGASLDNEIDYAATLAKMTPRELAILASEEVKLVSGRKKQKRQGQGNKIRNKIRQERRRSRGF